MRSPRLPGVVLVVVAAVAMVWANVAWSHGYEVCWHEPVHLSAFGRSTRSVADWINDGAMTLFFLLVGLDIKWEAVHGQHASWRQASGPIVAALGGMVIPALIYTAITAGGSGRAGWGIPMATDIAFPLSILTVLGERIPRAVTVFLTVLAIVDDLGAILAIALFYASHIAWMQVGAGVLVLALSLAANRRGLQNVWIYVLLGIGAWGCFLSSGIPASSVGAVFAFTIPMSRPTVVVAGAAPEVHPGASLGSRMMHTLRPWNDYLIIPLFVLANAGLVVPRELGQLLSQPVSLGVLAGLCLGKPIGIIAATWISRRWGLLQLPREVSMRHIWGVGCLAGIGFTMALFITALAFDTVAQQQAAKAAIMVASLISALLGIVILSIGSRNPTLRSGC